MYECRCDERLKVKVEGSTRQTYTGLRVTGTLQEIFIVVYYETIKRDPNKRLI